VTSTCFHNTCLKLVQVDLPDEARTMLLDDGGEGYCPLHSGIRLPSCSYGHVACAWVTVSGAIRRQIFDHGHPATMAAMSGVVQLLEYAVNNGLLCNVDVHYVAYAGRVAPVQWLLDRGHRFEWDIICAALAAVQGHLAFLTWLHEMGCPWDTDTPSSAVELGYLDCLQYAHEHGCPWDTITPRNAASNGHLGCLMYAHLNGCPWNEATPRAAARNGHLSCLQYAHEHGCPWDTDTTKAAASWSRVRYLEYALVHGCPVKRERSSCVAC
jgi:hypothetical protein